MTRGAFWRAALVRVLRTGALTLVVAGFWFATIAPEGADLGVSIGQQFLGFLLWMVACVVIGASLALD